MRLNLPYKWWVVKKEGDKITLSVVPPYGTNDNCFIFLDKKLVTEKDFIYFQNKKITDYKFYEFRRKTIGNEKAFGFIYKAINYDPARQIAPISEIWIIPSKGLVLSIMKWPNKYYEETLSDLFSNISFK